MTICSTCRMSSGSVGMTAEAYSDGTESLDVDPTQPCRYPPGSAGKVRAMAARYRSGLPLDDDRDATHAGEVNDSSRELFGGNPVADEPCEDADDLDELDPS